MAMLHLSISPRTSLGWFVGDAQRQAIDVLRGFGFEATDQVIAKMRWCDFEKIDLVVLSHFNGAKADSLTWREFGEAIALRSALFVMKASFECARILDSGDTVTEALALAVQRLARARANMSIAPAWATGMGSRTAPLQREGAAAAKRIKLRISEELPRWNANTASRLARELKTTPKNIRSHKATLQKKSERIR